MAKHQAPAKLTGGSGFNYEDYIADRFLLDMLAGTNSLGVEFGRVTRLDWQARDVGWLLDDLAVTCRAQDAERAALGSRRKAIARSPNPAFRATSLRPPGNSGSGSARSGHSA